MLHELRVHQIELEMQNEELCRTQTELAAERARYFDLYDLAPVGYFTVSDKGQILNANLAAAALLGFPRKLLVKHNVSQFIVNDDQELYYRQRKKLDQTGVLQACELRIIKKDQTVFWAKLVTTAMERFGPDSRPESVDLPAYRIVISDITESREIQDAMQSLARFPDEDPSAVLRIMAGGMIVYANPASLMLLSALNSGIGQRAPELLRQPALAALASGQNSETEIACANRLYVITCAPFPDSGYTNIYGRDVTTNRAAEQAAQEAFEREQEALAIVAASRTAVDVLEAIGDGVLVVDMTGMILSVNPAAELMTGQPASVNVNRQIDDFLCSFVMKHERDLVLEVLRRALRGDGRVSAFFTLNVHGTRVPVITAFSCIRNPDGKPGAFVVTLRDISELRAMQKTQVESERKYRELVENANSIIMRITPEHNITFFNEYAQFFFGYTAQEVLGKNVRDTITPATDSDGRDLHAMLKQITENPEQHGHNENENVCKDGRLVWIHWANRAVRDEQGRLVEILCIGTDVTARRQLEAESLIYQQRLRNLAERLTATEEEDRWRISSYIHDTILQDLSLATLRLGLITQAQSDLQSQAVPGQLLQLRSLLNTTIDECRMVMSDQTPPLLYELGLIPALNEFASQLKTKHGAQLIVEDIGQEKYMPHSLRGLLFESIRELIMNAIKHAGPCVIYVSVNHRDNGLLISVNDNGKGFAAEKVRKPSRSGGFGLFSIRQRLEGMAGQLEIESAPGKGTTVTICLPAS
ncbi:MAG: PAS domain S-box protein [bacterium]